MTRWSIALFTVYITLFCVGTTIVAAHSCGTVYDGLGAGQFDLNTQTSTSTIAAHWFGFDNDVLNYEWAIVSSALTPFLPGPGKCDQFRKTPDVHEWTNVQRATDASITDLTLEVGETYFVLLRVTNSDGKQVVTNSDGVLIVPKLSTSSSASTTSFLPPLSSSSSSSSSNQRNSRAVGGIADLSSSTCPIDAANRCTQSRKSVGTILQETYGDPVFNSESPVALLFLVGRLSDRARAGIFPDNGFTRQFQRDFEGIGLVGKTADFGDALIPNEESSSDDDDGLAPGDAPAWVIAPIAGGIFLCGLLVFLFLLITRILARNRRSDGRTSNSGGSGTFAAGEDGSEKKGYAGRSNIGVANTSDRTDISFPDTAIRRLSITHNEDATEDLAEATRSPRRKHPIMQSTSSSFRDYRNT